MFYSLYGFFVGLAIVLLFTGQEWWLHRFFPEDTASEHFRNWLTRAQLLTVIGMLVGARGYHLITDRALYQNATFWQLIATWNGGLGIFGAVLGAGIGWWMAYALQKLRGQLQNYQRPLTGLDALALLFPWAQAVGRWGNFANHELYGLPTNLPWAIWIPLENRLPGYETVSLYHPLFFYESLSCFILGTLLFFAAKKASHNTKFWPALQLGSGLWSGLVLWSYGSVRFGLEFLRLGTEPGLLGLTSGQWSSLLLWLIGLQLLARSLRSRSLQ